MIALLLEQIKCSNDVKKLSEKDLPKLCDEIRKEIIATVSNTGGHLASNLGAVELTVAIHRVYDTAVDRLIFDVGHQCYTHKIITGRQSKFSTLRQYNGISGFPKPSESNDDAFIAGHASTSIAVAYGIAKARTLKNEKYDVVAVIGDGALTGGLAYEGLSNVGCSVEPIVIILNDNSMSINYNVGGTARLIRKARLRPEYMEFKMFYRNTVGLIKPVYNATHAVKETIKKIIMSPTVFDDLGLNYIGPINGHDVVQLEKAIQYAKALREPVLLHVKTVKGKGYRYAEENPSKYHGVGPFNVNTGIYENKKASFSNVMGKELCNLAEKDNNIVAITAAMADGTGLTEFSHRFPQRFFDVGIAEGAAVSIAAGMAKQGLIPVFAVYSSFLQRAYDMLIHDVSLQQSHVVFCVDRAGIVGSDGETHNGSFDVDYLASIPGMTLLAPSSFEELQLMLHEAIYEVQGPVAIRYPRGEETDPVWSDDRDIDNDKPEITLLSYGRLITQCRTAAKVLRSKGIATDVIKINQLQKLDLRPVLSSVKNSGRLIVVEEVCSKGCIGEAVLSSLEQRGIKLKACYLLNLADGIVPQGTYEQLIKDYRLDSASICKIAEEIVNNE
jgi:1-deoxy-D-xylulose-5-phosphate synthase